LILKVFSEIVVIIRWCIWWQPRAPSSASGKGSFSIGSHAFMWPGMLLLPILHQQLQD